jgi:hypothetical protein
MAANTLLTSRLNDAALFRERVRVLTTLLRLKQRAAELGCGGRPLGRASDVDVLCLLQLRGCPERNLLNGSPA